MPRVEVGVALCDVRSLFVRLFIVIKLEKPYFTSRPGIAKSLAVYPLGPRSSSCGPAKGTPPPGDTLRAN